MSGYEAIAIHIKVTWRLQVFNIIQYYDLANKKPTIPEHKNQIIWSNARLVGALNPIQCHILRDPDIQENTKRKVSHESWSFWTSWQHLSLSPCVTVSPLSFHARSFPPSSSPHPHAPSWPNTGSGFPVPPCADFSQIHHFCLYIQYLWKISSST